MRPSLARFIPLTAASLLTLLASPARAQSPCPEGMVPAGKKKLLPGTRPRQQRRASAPQPCCWPGQTYSEPQGQCVGVPDCPDGTRLRGGTCERPSLDPAKREDIRAFLRLTGAARRGIASMDRMIQSYRAVMPQVPEQFWVEFRRDLDEEAMIELLVPIYAKHLSHEDVRALIEFYRSEAGQRFLQALPDIQRESRQAGQRLGATLAERLERRLRSEGHME